MKLSKKLKTKLKKRITIGVSSIITIIVLVAMSNSALFPMLGNLKETKLSETKFAQTESGNSGNSIEVTKDSTGINLAVNGESSSGVKKIEVFQGTNKIQEYKYTDGATEKQEKFKITIPFGETHQIAVKVNGETVSQKNVENMRYISTAQDLVNFRDAVNAGNNFEGKYVELLDNIDLSTVCSSSLGSWVPIGEATYTNKETGKDEKISFSGTFNGKFYKIQNLYVGDDILENTNVNDKHTIGLFSFLNKVGVIENLFMENVSITSN